MDTIRIEDIHLGSEVTYLHFPDVDPILSKGKVTSVNFEGPDEYTIEVNFREMVPLSQIRSVETSYQLYDPLQRPKLCKIDLQPWVSNCGKNLLSNFKIQPNYNNIGIDKVIFNGPATIVWFTDGTKTIVKKTEVDTDDREKAILLALTKKLLGNSTADLRRFLKDVESKVDNQNKKGK